MLTRLPSIARAGSMNSCGSSLALSLCFRLMGRFSRLAQDLSHPLITALQQECTRSSCPQMKAGEWLYLCVAHANDGAPEVYH